MAYGEKIPQEDLVRGEPFSIEDWTLPRNRHAAIHIGRKVLLETTRK